MFTKSRSLEVPTIMYYAPRIAKPTILYNLCNLWGEGMQAAELHGTLGGGEGGDEVEVSTDDASTNPLIFSNNIFRRHAIKYNKMCWLSYISRSEKIKSLMIYLSPSITSFLDLYSYIDMCNVQLHCAIVHVSTNIGS